MTERVPLSDLDLLGDAGRAAAAPMIICDRTGSIREANARAEEMFGGALVGKSVHHLIPLERRTSHKGMLAAFIDDSTSKARDMHTRRLLAQTVQGREFSVNIGIARMERDGVAYGIASIRDATRDVEAEERAAQSQRAESAAIADAEAARRQLEAEMQNRRLGGQGAIAYAAVGGIILTVLSAFVLAYVLDSPDKPLEIAKDLGLLSFGIFGTILSAWFGVEKSNQRKDKSS